uniref:LOB domain-containing protein n=1 Tax=Leersia perrieri TaxID=77586 RepID=A0A0D9V268_9ORYZ
MADPAAPLATHEGHETCAVCAHQGRTCPPDCRLAPHFPADKPKRFEYAYQIFGMRRILRALEADAAGLDAETRRREYGNIGMAGIVYTADARVEDPGLSVFLIAN